MSFLNPVNEPVLRFKSTDAGAPQINYNVRTAGDVKAVLKACLVTGYGAVASAGWTATNEVGNIIEFVSPSAAMGDYRLGVDDSTATKTDWYYQYQNVRSNPINNAPVKAFTGMDKTHASNGWQLLVTQRGLLFIEIVRHSFTLKPSARITYFGQAKSALPNIGGENIVFFNIGHNGAITNSRFYSTSSTPNVYAQISNYSSVYTSTAASNILQATNFKTEMGFIDLISPIYLVPTSSADTLVLGELPIISKIINNPNDTYRISDETLVGRPVLSVCTGTQSTNAVQAINDTRTFIVPLDYWSY